MRTLGSLTSWRNRLTRTSRSSLKMSAKFWSWSTRPMLSSADWELTGLVTALLSRPWSPHRQQNDHEWAPCLCGNEGWPSGPCWPEHKQEIYECDCAPLLDICQTTSGVQFAFGLDGLQGVLLTWILLWLLKKKGICKETVENNWHSTLMYGFFLKIFSVLHKLIDFCFIKFNKIFSWGLEIFLGDG